MSQISELTKHIQHFSIARDWKQFHNPKDLALSLVLESTEVLEHFQWKNGEQIGKHIETHKEEISEELADVATYLFQLADDLGIDLAKAIENKLEKSNAKYPVEKAKGTSKKYTELT